MMNIAKEMSDWEIKKDCVSYPYLLKKNFTSRLMVVIGDCSVCPIVFNVYKLLKDEVWHKHFSADFSEFY